MDETRACRSTKEANVRKRQGRKPWWLPAERRIGSFGLAAMLLSAGCVELPVASSRAPGSQASVHATLSTTLPSDPVALARQEFSRFASCPESRIVVKPSDEPAEKPPPGIEADPERLAIWRKNSGVDSARVFDVSGCDQNLRLAYHPLPGRDAGFFTVASGSVADSFKGESTNAMLARLARTLPTPKGPRLGVGYVEMAGGGLRVVFVLPGGASQGTLRPDDVILTVGGEPATDSIVLSRVVQAHAGKPLGLGIRREGQDMEVTVDIQADKADGGPPKVPPT
jgi:hypothetical protein